LNITVEKLKEMKRLAYEVSVSGSDQVILIAAMLQSEAITELAREVRSATHHLAELRVALEKK
jgi:hypothetical protein